MGDFKEIKQALFHITYACTHNCPMCYANAQNSNHHPHIEKLCQIADRLILLGVKDITLVGGDPALHPDVLDLVKHIKNNDAKISILSNTLDFKKPKEQFIDYIDVFEGTIHHSNKEKHDSFCGASGAFDKLINNLKYFSSAQKSVGIAINLIPYNYNEIYSIANKLTQQQVKLDHIVFQRIIQFGRAHDNYHYELTKEMLNSIMEQVEKIKTDFDLNIIFEDPVPMCSINSKYHKYISPCECGISKVSVDVDGNLSRCGADVFHTFGSVFEESIIDKWNNDCNLNCFRNKTYLPSSCLSCKNLQQCGGGCPISRNPEKGFSVDYLCHVK